MHASLKSWHHLEKPSCQVTGLRVDMTKCSSAATEAIRRDNVEYYRREYGRGGGGGERANRRESVISRTALSLFVWADQ